MHTTSVSLLERLRQPSQQEAWGRFVELYTPLLYYWARQLGLQEQDAADLVQDVFMTLVRKLPEFSYDQNKSFRGWLRMVTLNKWREHRRRQARQPRGEPGALPDQAVPDEAEAFWEAEYRQHLVERALHLMQAECPPRPGTAGWVCAVAGRPAAEVAAELGIREGAVRAAKFRVLSRLRQELHGLLN
jgi:RNA polymerase sigma-70 factor (ECF subfamily)